MSFNNTSFFGEYDILPSGALQLSSCSFSGSSVFVLPRNHVTCISSGRSFAFGFAILGLSILTSYLYVHNLLVSEIASLMLVMGILMLVISFISLIPSSMCITTSSGARYVSTACCNDIEPLVNWLGNGGEGRTPTWMNGNATAIVMSPMSASTSTESHSYIPIPQGAPNRVLGI